MDDPFSMLSRKEADLVLLVLASQGIIAHSERENRFFNVVVDHPQQQERAEKVLRQYYAENRKTGDDPRIPAFPLSWRSQTTIVMMLLLVAVHFFAVYHGSHRQLIYDYGSSALYVIQGEHYRLVTSLMLHADLQHLAGNLAGLFVFGASLLNLTGPGAGCLMILLSGMTGNLMNAYFYKTAHLSIGASTAVLGTAGVLTAMQVVKRRGITGINPRTFVPLAAGAALVGMLSGGENTDLSAHLFGFISGLLIGTVYAVFGRSGRKSAKKEAVYLCVCAASAGLAWMRAF